MIVRAVAVVIGALFLAVLVVRQAIVDAYIARSPAAAARAWPGHPNVILASGLTEVGSAAASRQPVNRATVQAMLMTGAKVPLAPEPFLVRGVEAQTAGNADLSARAFLEARKRNPRSIPARYFLAEHYLKAGQVPRGLAELAALTRLVPQSLDGIAPHLAAYARAPGGAARVRALLRDQPQLEPLLINQLAANPGDAGLALSLWSGQRREQDRAWQERLINTLITAGRFREARSAWKRFDPRAKQARGLVDPQFEGRGLPPFGWTFASGPAGVVEPQPGGRLRILYYGRDNIVLASQLLMLGPGRHRLAMRVSGSSSAASSLAWTLLCLPSSREIGRVGLNSATGGLLAADFTIPPQGCTAQRLELVGIAVEMPEQADLTVADLRLDRRSQ